MFEDSRTKLMVLNVTNANAASFAVLQALTGSAGAFYYEPQTFTETALSTNATLYHRFAFRNTKGVLSFTKPFRYADVKNGGYAAYSARVEQVSYLGYNGTSGSMDAANSTYYGLQIVLNHTFGMLNNSPITITIPYKSSAAASQYEVANGLASAAKSILKRQNSAIKVELINSGAQLDAVAAGGAATASVINGSTLVTLSSDQSTVVSAGSFLRLGTSGAGTAAVYKVASIAAGGLLVTLDRPYEGATDATYAAATIETVTEGNWGIKFTGVSTTDANFNSLTDEPFVVDFTLQAGDFTTALVTNTTKSFIGTGTYQLVAAQEAYTQFQNKDRVVSRLPQTSYNIDAVAGNTYNMFSFELYDDNFVDATTGIRPVSKNRVVLAVLVGLTESFHTVLGFGA